MPSDCRSMRTPSPRFRRCLRIEHWRKSDRAGGSMWMATTEGSGALRPQRTPRALRETCCWCEEANLLTPVARILSPTRLLPSASLLTFQSAARGIPQRGIERVPWNLIRIIPAKGARRDR